MNIVLVDNDDTRANQMLKAFQGLGNSFHLLYNPSEDNYVLHPYPNGIKKDLEDFQENIDLVLIHARDRERLEEVENYQLAVWYGGLGLNDPDIPAGQTRLRRPIFKDGHGALNHKEAEQLIAFAESFPQKPPTFVFYPNPQVEACLRLCQQLYARENLDQLDAYNEVFQEAPVQTHWSQFRKDLTPFLQAKPEVDYFDPEYLGLIGQFRARILTEYNH